MAFAKKTWKNRLSEFPTRRLLTKENGTTEIVTVERSEGTIMEEGDAFSEANMNDLEDRIEAEFSQINVDLSELGESVGNGKTLVANAITGKGVATSSSATFQQMATNIANIPVANPSYANITSVNYTFTASTNGTYIVVAVAIGGVVNTSTEPTASVSVSGTSTYKLLNTSSKKISSYGSNSSTAYSKQTTNVYLVEGKTGNTFNVSATNGTVRYYKII